MFWFGRELQYGKASGTTYTWYPDDEVSRSIVMFTPLRLSVGANHDGSASWITLV